MSVKLSKIQFLCFILDLQPQFSVTFLPSSLCAAEEDAGDAEQDAAADARQGLVMPPAAELKLRRHLLFLPHQQRDLQPWMVATLNCISLQFGASFCASAWRWIISLNISVFPF